MNRYPSIAGACVAFCVACAPLAASLTEYIEARRNLAPGEQIDFVFLSVTGEVSRQSVGDADGDGIITIAVPSNAQRKTIHTSSCLHVTFENAIISGLTNGSSQQAMVPLFRDVGTALTVVPRFSVLDLGGVPSFSINDTIAVVAGSSPLFPAATFGLPSTGFFGIPDSEFASGFAPFTGVARVEELLDIRVYVVPAPGAAAMLAIGGLFAARRRR